MIVAINDCKNLREEWERLLPKDKFLGERMPIFFLMKLQSKEFDVSQVKLVLLDKIFWSEDLTRSKTVLEIKKILGDRVPIVINSGLIDFGAKVRGFSGSIGSSPRNFETLKSDLAAIGIEYDASSASFVKRKKYRKIKELKDAILFSFRKKIGK